MGRRIALVVQGTEGGGVATVANFLIYITMSSGYLVDIISPVFRFNDKYSTLIFRPSTWLKSPIIHKTIRNDLDTYVIGARFAELEFQRYMPRKKLTELLRQYDLIQVVSGSPALAYVTKGVERPVCLFAATMIHLERKSALQKAPLLRKIYGNLNLPLVSAIDKSALRHVNHVFAETLYTKEAILPYISADKISIDTIGVDTEQFNPIQRRTDDYILSTGRLADPRKNIPLLFKAYALLRQSTPDAPRLVLAGMSGPSESDWVLAQKLGIRDFIDFKHKVPLDELISLYQNASFFVLSSNEEGLGIVLLEAMACATPVISTRCGGPDSVVSEEVGFLTPINDAEIMADRMVWMLQNPEKRRQMGDAGRQMILRRFSNEVVAQKYLTVYDKLLSNHT